MTDKRYDMPTPKDIYKILKQQADLAYEIAQETNNVLDWEWFLMEEENVADYALKHEKEIWDE